MDDVKGMLGFVVMMLLIALCGVLGGFGESDGSQDALDEINFGSSDEAKEQPCYAGVCNGVDYWAIGQEELAACRWEADPLHGDDVCDSCEECHRLVDEMREWDKECQTELEKAHFVCRESEDSCDCADRMKNSRRKSRKQR